MNSVYNRLIWMWALMPLFALVPRQVSAQPVVTDGYKGIWFSLNQLTQYGDKYSGGLATYTSSHVPMAIYSKKAHKTFFVYGGTTSGTQKHLLIMLSYYDHKKKQVPKPVVVYDKKGVDDPHDNASLSIDGDGYLWVFISGRNTTRPGFIIKSQSPYNIDNFTQVTTGNMTYPQPWYLGNQGFVYLFTKYTNGRELYVTTSSTGANWLPDRKLAGFGGHYQVSNKHNGKIYSTFNYHPGGNVDKRTNLYLVQSGDGGKTWQNVKGDPLKLPLDNKQNNALVIDYEAEGKLVYLNDLNFDKQGNPVILAVISRHHAPGPQGDPRQWTILHCKNGSWHEKRAMTSTNNYDMGSLYIYKHQWLIIGPTEAGPQRWGTGGQMALWKSNDEGMHWQKVKDLTTGSQRNHSYARRPLNAHNDFYAFWADGNADSLSISHLYFCNKKGQVYQLPYTMQNNFEKPTPFVQ